jgi:hypothetical protein
VNVIDAVTLDMGSTKTYARRELTWFPMDQHGEGVLVIRQWAYSRRRGTGRLNYECDLYHVCEEAPPIGVMARCFRLLNRFDPAQEFPYRVLVGQNTSCSCTAGRCHTESDKHTEAIALLIEGGYMDGLDDDEPAERYQDTPGEMTAHELAHCPRCGGGSLTTGPGHVPRQGHGTLTVCDGCGDLVRFEAHELATA